MFNTTKLLTSNFLFGADGGFTTWIQNTGSWVLGAVALAVGIFLIVRMLMDFKTTIGGSQKDWGGAAVGLGVGLIGGLIGWWGAQGLLGFFKNNGSEIPKS